MRVTSNTLPNKLIPQLQTLEEQQFKLQQQVSTGQRVTKPSDDPAAMGRILDIQSEKRAISQYQRNGDRVESVGNFVFSAVQELQRISQEATEVAARSSGNDLVGSDAYTAYAAEVNSLLEQALTQGNAQYLDDYAFGGSDFGSPAYGVTRDGNGDITAVTYDGSATSPEIYIAEEIKIKPYPEGTTNQEIATFMNNLVALRDALASEDPTAVNTARDSLFTDEDNLVITMSEVGANLLRTEMANDSISERFIDLEERLSREADVDISQTIVELTQAQNAYQAAISMGGQLLNESLLNYI